MLLSLSSSSSFSRHRLLAGICVALAVGAAPEAASAGGFQIRTQSAEAMGAGLAGAAAGSSLSFSFWNPAALSAVQGMELELVGNAILPSFRIRPDAATNAIVAGAGGVATPDVQIGMDAVVPATYAAARMNRRTTLGLAITSPFGLATKSPYDWSGQAYSRTSQILSVNVNPMAAYQVSDTLSIGAGLMVQHFSARLSQAGGLAAGAPTIALSGDDIGVGFNLGLQWIPEPGTRIGVGYRSAIDHELNGDLDLAVALAPIAADLTTPEIVTFGLRHELRPGTHILAGAEWANWSRLGAIAVTPAQGGAPLAELNMNYRDGWLFSAGLEHAATNTLSVRGGYGYEIAPLTDATRDTRLPEVNQHILSAGLSWQMRPGAVLDAAWTHSRAAEDGPITILSGDDRFVGLPFTADSDLKVHILSLGLRIALGN